MAVREVGRREAKTKQEDKRAGDGRRKGEKKKEERRRWEEEEAFIPSELVPVNLAVNTRLLEYPS